MKHSETKPLRAVPLQRLVRLLSFVGEACAWTTGTLLTITFLWLAGYSFIDQWPASGIGVALGPVIWGIGYGLYRTIKWVRKIRETNGEVSNSGQKNK